MPRSSRPQHHPSCCLPLQRRAQVRQRTLQKNSLASFAKSRLDSGKSSASRAYAPIEDGVVDISAMNSQARYRSMSPADITELKHAKSLLEHPNFFAKVAGFIGAPVEKALQLLPGKWSSVVNTATSKALEVALRGAIATLKDGKIRSSSNALHKIMLSVT